MNYESISKEELIKILQFMEKEKGFTYEDKVKLLILEKAPFTVWASDRNCIIKLWTKKAEVLYGYSQEEAKGKDFVDLFVAEDEMLQAREDQKDIIDNGTEFHNFACDKAKNGNTIKLLTYCNRIEDPASGEFWNAEIGVVMDYYEEEIKRWQKIVSESRVIRQFQTDESEFVQRKKDQFNVRYQVAREQMRQCERQAIIVGKRAEYKKESKDIQDTINHILSQVYQLLDQYLTELCKCNTLDSCNRLREQFLEKYNVSIEELENVNLDIYELSRKYNVESEIASEKQEMIGRISDRLQAILDDYIKHKEYIQRKMDEYRINVNDEPEMEGRYGKLHAIFVRLEEGIKMIKSALKDYSSKVLVSTNRESINAISTNLQQLVEQMQNELEAIKNEL